MNHVRFFLILLMLGATSPCGAGEIVHRQGQGTLKIQFDGSTPRIALADLITVTLEVEGKKSLRVKAADRFPSDFPWLLVELSKVERVVLEGDRVRWRLRYRFAPREPSKKLEFTFPEVRLRETDDPAEEQTLTWPALVFEVTTAITEPDAARLRDITSIEKLADDMPADASWRWVVLGISCVLLLAVGLVWRFLMRRRNARTAAGLALYEWHRLMAIRLPEQGHSERFVTLLTLLVRQYLERQFAIPARRQTTPEFLTSLAKHSHLTDDEKRFLTAFLPCADAVKFAATPMSVAECSRWAEATREFLQRRAHS